MVVACLIDVIIVVEYIFYGAVVALLDLEIPLISAGRLRWMVFQ